ncbi:MAG: hypothetical protein AAFV51_03060 [Pseudomonadota bacterium]
MKTVVCMKWGARYGAEYANRLYAMVRRNVTGDLRFVCFTDDRAGLDPGIEGRPLPQIDLPERVRWLPWRKISLWRPDLGEGDLEGEVLFLDLDIIITGPMDDFFSYRPGEVCIIENWTQKGEGIGNTTAYRWTVGEHGDIYENFARNPEAVLSKFRASQQYVSACLPQKVYWPSEWCVSFKHSLLPPFPMNWVKTPALPADARLIAFTGHPDPDEALEGRWAAPLHKRIYKHVKPTPWIAEYWK